MRKNLKYLRSNHGGEFKNESFIALFNKVTFHVNSLPLEHHKK